MVKAYPQLSYKDIVKKLQTLGFVKYSTKSRGKGSHEIRWNAKSKAQTVVPKHGNKDISITVIKGICRHIGMTMK